MSDERIVQFGGVFVELLEKRKEKISKHNGSYRKLLEDDRYSEKQALSGRSFIKLVISPEVKQLACTGHGFL